MKTLYYKFIILLIQKPFVHMALSIFSILVMRVLFVNIIYAEDVLFMEGRMSKSEQIFLPAKTYQDCNPGEVFKISEIKYVTSKGDIIHVSKTTPQIIGLSINPEPTVDGNLTCEPENNLGIKDNKSIQETSSHENSIEWPKSDQYLKIIHDFGLIIDNAKSKKDFIQQTLNFTKHVIPQELWSKNRMDLNNPDNAISLYVNNFASNLPEDLSSKDALAGNIYMSAIYAYNVGTICNILNNEPHFEKVYIETLNKILGEPVVNSLFKVYNHVEALDKAKRFKRPPELS